jgi:hypothetical protein
LACSLTRNPYRNRSVSSPSPAANDHYLRHQDTPTSWSRTITLLTRRREIHAGDCGAAREAACDRVAADRSERLQLPERQLASLERIFHGLLQDVHEADGGWDTLSRRYWARCHSPDAKLPPSQELSHVGHNQA